MKNEESGLENTVNGNPEMRYLSREVLERDTPRMMKEIITEMLYAPYYRIKSLYHNLCNKFAQGLKANDGDLN